MRRAQNFTPETYAARREKRPGKRPFRPPQSCKPCRASKVACDREQPCSSCLRKVKPSLCAYDGPEDSMNGKASIVSPSAPAGIRVVTEKERPSRKRHCTKHPTAALLSSNEHGKVFYVGETAWTRGANDIVRCLFEPGNFFEGHWKALAQLKVFYPDHRKKTLFDCIDPSPIEVDSKDDIVEIIPDPDVTEVLISRFMITFNMTHPMLDQTEFQLELEGFWEGREVSELWLALLISIVAVGHQIPILPLPMGKTKSKTRIQGAQVDIACEVHCVRSR
jgi:hypothetical protein